MDRHKNIERSQRRMNVAILLLMSPLVAIVGGRIACAVLGLSPVV